MIIQNTQFIENAFEARYGGVLWSTFKENAPTRITQELLSELTALQNALLDEHSASNPDNKVSFQVLNSNISNIFSLGGDLNYFCDCARKGDNTALKKYAGDAIELVYKTATNYHLPITTIALVKGLAIGGGFEMALSANYFIAEEQARFAFPETRFGLFPGMGAYTLLRQRVPNHIAEEIIYSSREYTAKELFKMDVIDTLCKTGEGSQITRQFIKERHKRHLGIQAMRKMVQQYSPIDKKELGNIVNHWVDTVMGLDAKQLRLIEALAQTSLK